MQVYKNERSYCTPKRDEFRKEVVCAHPSRFSFGNEGETTTIKDVECPSPAYGSKVGGPKHMDARHFPLAYSLKEQENVTHLNGYHLRGNIAEIKLSSILPRYRNALTQ